MLVVPGQAVEAGQGLIGTARSERDGTLIFDPGGRHGSGTAGMGDKSKHSAGRDFTTADRRKQNKLPAAFLPVILPHFLPLHPMGTGCTAPGIYN